MSSLTEGSPTGMSPSAPLASLGRAGMCIAVCESPSPRTWPVAGRRKRQLRKAVDDGNAFSVHRVLLDPDVDTHHAEFEGVTSLHKAAYRGHVDTVKMLIARKARVDLPDSRGQTPLHLASEAQNEDVILLLLRHQAQCDARDMEGLTPARVLVAQLHGRLVEPWRLGPCFEAFSKAYSKERGWLRRKLGIWKPDSLEPDQVIIPRLGDVYENDRDLSGISYEWLRHGLALEAGDENLRVLFGSSGDPSVNGIVPALSRACQKGDLRIVRDMLQARACPNAHDIHGHTALHVAAATCQTQMVKILLTARADPVIEDLENMTPLATYIKHMLRKSGDYQRQCALGVETLFRAEETELTRMREELKLKEPIDAPRDLVTRVLPPTPKRPEGVEPASKFGDRRLLLAIRTGGSLTPTMWDDV